MKKLLLSYSLFLAPFFLFSQNVGIGTNSPASKLHVKGTGAGTQIVLEENAGSILRISNEATAIGPYIGTTSNHSLTLVANNAGRMTILPNGNVGVGTSSPEQLFSVAGGMVIDQNNLNNGTVTTMLHFGSSSGEGIGSRRTSGTNQYGLDFYTQSFNRMTITNGGNVGIGLLNPSSKLEIRGALGFSSSTKRWEMNYDSTAGYFYIDEFGSGRRLAIKNGGNVGINTLNPQTTLDVNGDVNIENKLLLNNSAGNNGQVLMSNGSGSAPTWRNASFSNPDRFLFLSQNCVVPGSTAFNDTLLYTPLYSMSTAISYNSSTGLFTANKSGLYSFECSFLPFGYTSSTAESPLVAASLLIKYPAGSWEFISLYYGSVDFIDNIPGYGFNYGKTCNHSFALYLLSGTQFYFSGFYAGNYVITNKGFGANSPVSINLISE